MRKPKLQRIKGIYGKTLADGREKGMRERERERDLDPPPPYLHTTVHHKFMKESYSLSLLRTGSQAFVRTASWGSLRLLLECLLSNRISYFRVRIPGCRYRKYHRNDLDIFDKCLIGGFALYVDALERGSTVNLGWRLDSMPLTSCNEC